MPMKNKIEIEPKGSYFQIDENGFLINPTSLEKIQEEWKPVVDDIVEAYKSHFGEKLKNVYIRGSVAKGEAIKNISDVDSFSYIDLPRDSIDTEWKEEARSKIEKKYPFIEGAELMCRPFAIAHMNIVFLNQSVCVYGESIAVPKVKPGKDMMFHIPNLESRAVLLEEKFQKADSEESIKSACVWFAKDMLRTGFELTMERSQKYTRDLYRCYETFAEYYPEKEPEMREVLDLALNPTADKKKIKEIMDNLGAWLLVEMPNHFEVKNAEN